MAEQKDKVLYEQAKKRVALRQSVLWFVFANVVCWAVYLITQPGYMWPLWVTFGTGIGLLATIIGYTSSTFSVESEYEKLKNQRK